MDGLLLCDHEDVAAAAVQLECQLLALERERLVELEEVEGAPHEGVMDFADVVVLAVDAQEVVYVYVDNDDAQQLSALVPLEEDHLVEGVLHVAKLEQPGRHRCSKGTVRWPSRRCWT